MKDRQLLKSAMVVLAVLTTNPAAATQAATEDSTVVVMTTAERFQRVGDLRQAGRFDEALELLNTLRADFPFDVDYALARAQVLEALHRDEEALQELRDATVLAPDYEDVWKIRDRLLGMQQSASAVDERKVLRQNAGELFPNATWWRSDIATAADRWLLVVGAGYDDLSNGLPSWNNQFVELWYQKDPSRQYRVQMARNARYSSTDMTVGLGAEYNWGKGWLAGLDISLAGEPDYLPELGYGLHVGKVLDAGWVVDLRYQRREYTSEDVSSMTGTVEKYVGNFRYAYSLGLSRLRGASSFANHTLTTNWYYSDDSSVGITVSGGDEAESLGNGQVLETSVKGVTLSGDRRINTRIGIRWYLGISEQGDFYRRRFVGLAASFRF